MSIDEQPMNVYWSGKRTETSNNFKTNYKGSVATKNNLPSLGNKTGDMYNVTESGENFIWNGNSWDSLSGDTLKTLNWQKSEKASTVAIYPVPETILYPIVEFAFTETDPTEGDKSPNNPSTIIGVSSITVTKCETVGVNSSDYVINLNDTYYGGSIDFVTGLMTVTWVKEVLSASNFSTVGVSQDVVTTIVFNTSRNHGGGSTTSSSVLTCNRFPTVSGSGDTEHVRFSGAGSGTPLNIYIDRSRLDLSDAVNPASPTTAELKAAMIKWFSANETFVVYQVSEPFTVKLSPMQIYSLSQTDLYTPCLNTLYTDASAIQVGYAKSPIRSEYELAQAIAAIEESE